MRSSEKRYLMDLTKEIVVAKLSTSAPGQSTADSGVNIGNMYESIYDKIQEIYFKDNDNTREP